MLRLLLAIILCLLFQNLAFATDDCGASANRGAIKRASVLLVSEYPVRPTVGEYPTKEGSAECIRLAFSIAPWGAPFRVKIIESSGNAAFEIAAIEAFSKYKFRPVLLGFARRYTLVLYGIDNKAPANYLNAIKGIKGGGDN